VCIWLGLDEKCCQYNVHWCLVLCGAFHCQNLLKEFCRWLLWIWHKTARNLLVIDYIRFSFRFIISLIVCGDNWYIVLSIFCACICGCPLWNRARTTIVLSVLRYIRLLVGLDTCSSWDSLWWLRQANSENKHINDMRYRYGLIYILSITRTTCVG